MTIKIEIDGKYHSFEELSAHQQELYRDEFIEAERIQAEFLLDSPKPKYGGKILVYPFLGTVMAILGLFVLPIFSRVNVAIKMDSFWLSVWGISVAIVLGWAVTAFMVAWRNGSLKIPTGVGLLKKAGELLLMLLVFCALSSFAALNGLPIILHHLTATDGEVTVTVAKKVDTYSKRGCDHRLMIKEFPWFSSDHVCPSKEFYEETYIGGRITLIGKISEYGVEANKMRLETLYP